MLAGAFRPRDIALRAKPGTPGGDPPGFFRTFVTAALSEGADLVVAGDPILGVASWFGPERHGPSPEAMGVHGFGEVLEQADRTPPSASLRWWPSSRASTSG